MKLILLVFIQMCLIPLVLSDAKRPEKPQPCGDEYDECPPGYKCEYDVCVKIVPTTTTTTKKPTPPKPSKDNIFKFKTIFLLFSTMLLERKSL
uniref:Candidate secreted effector n=1 Tax=Meloidogyne incognita TaxID=6306 RepID=A0A914KRL6_MELIC